MTTPQLRFDRNLTSGDEIRLIQLEPGYERAPLHAKILYRHLSEDPDYRALSYTWASPFNEDHVSWSQHVDLQTQHDLYVNADVVKIRKNLFGALSRLRDPTKALTLWIDALCIQQSHDEEKAHQIKHMRAIYEKASRVVIWLGPSDSTSEKAMSTLESAYRFYLRSQPHSTLGATRVSMPPPTSRQQHEDSLTSASFGKMFGMAIKSEVPIPDYPIEAVANLLNRAYWGRGWCWQEFAVAKQVEIVCGHKSLEDSDIALHVFMATWDTLKDQLRRTPYALDHRPWSMMELRRSFRNLVFLKSLGFEDNPTIQTPDTWMLPVWAHQNPEMNDMGKAWLYRECISRLSMKELLKESSNAWLETSQKVDQIFALIGMSIDANELGIKVDYSSSWETVYTQLTMAYVNRKDLWFLNYCQTDPSIRSSTLPSWVPDWSQGYRGAPIRSHYAPLKGHLGDIKGEKQPEPEVMLETHGRLRLRGIITDEIEWISPTRINMSVNQLETFHRRRLYRWIRDVVAQCPSQSRLSIWNVMIAGSTILPLPQEYHERFAKEEMESILDHAFDSILNQDDVEDETLRSVILSYLRCFMQATNMRHIFRTVNGRLGLASEGVKLRDRVVVFMGVDTAFVVRQVAGVALAETPRYRLQGETFVHGLMENEELKSRAVEDIILE